MSNENSLAKVEGKGRMPFTSISTSIMPARLPEIGKIKIGGKGEEKTSQHGKKFRMPTKWDHFKITHVNRDEKGDLIVNEEIMASLPDNPTELDVMLMYDDIELNFPNNLAYYKGKTRFCVGNGFRAHRLNEKTGELSEIGCTETIEGGCPFKNDRKCKPNGRLSVILRNAKVTGGTFVFRTHGWNSVSNILNALRFIQATTGGILAGIPLRLRVFPKAVSDVEGVTQVHVVTIEYDGPPEDLRQKAVEIATTRAHSAIDVSKMRALEAARVKELQDRPYEDAGEEIDDITPEYYPEEQEDYEDPEAEEIQHEEVAEEPEPEKPEPAPKPEKPEPEVTGNVGPKKVVGQPTLF